MGKLRLGPLAVGMFALALVLAACGGGDEGGGATGVTAATGGGATGATGGGTSLTIEGFAFHPDTLTAGAGETVTYSVTNNDSALHSFTVDDLGVDVDVPGGDTVEVSVTFPDSGSAGFRCKYHSSMTGTLEVG